MGLGRKANKEDASEDTRTAARTVLTSGALAGSPAIEQKVE